MPTYNIYSDLHIGAPHEIKTKINFTKNTIFLGDNFDLKNSDHKDLPKIEKLRNQTIKKIKTKGGIFISGNHSLKIPKEFFKIRNKILFTHGDIIAYGLEGAKKWRRKRTPGKNQLYRFLLKIYKIIYPCHKIPNIKQIQRAHDLSKQNKCHTIIFGHFHPKKLTTINYNKIKIIIIPRGLTKIKL